MALRVCQNCLRLGSTRLVLRRSQKRGFARVAVEARRSSALRELQSLEMEAEEDKIPRVTKLEWNKPLGILLYPDPKLRAVNAIVDVFDESLKLLAREMFDCMYASELGGVGLAAPQVGVNVRLMVLNPDPERDPSNELVLVNPRVISASKGKGVYEEGCLSFPNLHGDVWRPSKVKVSAQDLEGKKRILSMEKFPARVFQHEYDHLQGELFFEKMEPEIFENIRKELVTLEEEFLAKYPGAAIQRVQ